MTSQRKCPARKVQRNAIWVATTLRHADWPMPDDVQRLRVERKLLDALEHDSSDLNLDTSAWLHVGTWRNPSRQKTLTLAAAAALAMLSLGRVVLQPVVPHIDSGASAANHAASPTLANLEFALPAERSPSSMATGQEGHGVLESSVAAASADEMREPMLVQISRPGQPLRESALTSIRLAANETARAEFRGATLELSSGAWLEIDDGAGVALQLRAGKMDVHFPAQRGKSLALTTPLVAFTTFGASFSATVSARQTKLQVVDGSVKASNFGAETTRICGARACGSEVDVVVQEGEELWIRSMRMEHERDTRTERAHLAGTASPALTSPDPSPVAAVVFATNAIRESETQPAQRGQGQAASDGANALGTPQLLPRAEHEGMLLLSDARRDLQARQMEAARARVHDLLSTPVDGETRVEALLLLAETYRFAAPQHAADINRQAVALARGSAREAHALFELAYVLDRHVHDEPGALRYYEELLRLEHGSARSSFARAAIERLER